MDAITRGKPIQSLTLDSGRVKLFAEAFGVSLRELAKFMGCDHAYLLRVLQKKQRISTKYMTKLLDVLQELARSKPLSPFAFLRELPSPAAATVSSPLTETQLRAVDPAGVVA